MGEGTDRHARTKRLAGAAGAAGAGWLASKGLEEYAGSLRGKPFEPADYDKSLLTHPRMAADAPKLRQELQRTGVSVPLKIGPSSATWYEKFRGKPAGITVATADLPTAFHEIGHAHMPVLGEIWNVAHRATRSSGADVLRGGLLLGALAEPANDKGMHAFVNKHAPVMIALSFLPNLIEESRASLGALKGLKEVGYPAAKGIKSLAASLATYLAIPVAATAASHFGRNAVDVNSKPREKAAAAGAAPAMPKMTGQLRLSTTQASMAPIGQLKPKTTAPHPGAPEGTFHGIPAAKPPSLSKYYRDATQSMVPGRGART